MRPTIRRILPLLLILVLPAIALAANTLKWTLTLSDPLREELGPSAERREKIGDEARLRLEARLKAAQANDAVVKRIANGDLTVELRPKQDAMWYRALLTAPGQLEILPVDAAGYDWMQIASELPEGVEMRGENPRPDFIWSANRDQLEHTLRRTAVVGMRFAVGPADQGWRSYALGATSIAGATDVKSARVRRSNAGNAYVAATISTSVADRLAAAEYSEVKGWAVVLDGEVVDVISRDALLLGKLEMSAPQRLKTREESVAWAQQVAGRMAAPLPVPIAVVQE